MARTLTSQEEIEWHGSNGPYNPVAAVNVKFHGRWPFDRPSEGDYAGKSSSELIDEIAEIMGGSSDEWSDSIWENIAESFWEEANYIARERGFERVYSEGRSGGWMLPYPYIDADPRSDKVIDDFGERSRYQAFARRIREGLRYVDADLRAETEFRRDEAEHFKGC